MVKLATWHDIAQSDYYDAGPCLACYTDTPVIFRGSTSNIRPKIEGVGGKTPEPQMVKLALPCDIEQFRTCKISRSAIEISVSWERFFAFQTISKCLGICCRNKIFFGFIMKLDRT